MTYYSLQLAKNAIGLFAVRKTYSFPLNITQALPKSIRSTFGLRHYKSLDL